MLINVASLHISFLANALVRWFLQCLDRGCTCDKKRTRQTIQQDYEDINTDSDFEIELRYANLLFMLGVCFLYSSGMPILYPIGAAYFLLGYWIDKFLLIKASKKPVRYDGYIANKSLSWYKFIIVMHVIAGCLIYSNSSIILTRYVFGENSTIRNIWEKNAGGWKVKDFFMLHEWLFVGSFVGFALIYCFWAVIVNTYYYIRSCTGVQSPIRFKLDRYEADFYSCLDFDSLLYERISAKTWLDKYGSLGDEAKEKEVKSEYEAFVQVFKKKLRAIDRALINFGKNDPRTKDEFAYFNLDESLAVEKIIEKGIELGNLTSEPEPEKSAITNELTSYDLMRNDEYARLSIYEKILAK